jgi:stage II sporulation protein D
MEEMGSSFPDEALVAQAVCARSYAVSRMQGRRGRSYDLRDDQRSQVYRGLPTARGRAQRLASESRGWVLVHAGDLLPAYYSSTCGGWTRAAGEAFGGTTLPPLVGAPCGACQDSPRYRWSVRCDIASVARRLGLDAASLSLGHLQHRESGRLQSVTLIDRRGPKQVDVTSLRRALGGRTHSTWITAIERERDALRVEGRGFGHGVGLCQYGARTLAWAGMDAAAILARYFPGATLATLYADVSD